MDSAALPSQSHVESNGSHHREQENDCTDENSEDEEFQRLKTYLSSELSSFSLFSITRSTIPLESFVGLKEVRRAIFQQLEYHGHGGNNWKAEQDRILLFGATGTGKTHLVHAIANYLSANLITCAGLSGHKIIHEWARAKNMDMYTKAIYQLCQEKRAGGRTILLIENVDAFPQKLEKHKKKLIRFFRQVQLCWRKVQEEDENSDDHSQLTIFGTSYTPKWLDEEVVLCFHQRIYVPTLNFQERKQLFQRVIQKCWKWGHVMEPKDLDWLARRTYAILTSEIEAMVVRKAVDLQYVKKLSELEEMSDSEMRLRMEDDFEWRPLRIEDFKKVLGGFLPLESEEFYEFETFQRKFGTGPFMKIYERDDYDEDNPGKKRKTKRGWIWRVVDFLGIF